MTRARPLVIASLLLAACSKSADPDKIAPTGPATAAALCQELTTVFQDRVVACLGVPPAWAQQPDNGPDCSHWDASVAAGRLRYDPFYGDACVNLARTTPCAEFFQFAIQFLVTGGGTSVGACGPALQGLVPAGSACVTGKDCASGSYCDGSGICGGTCKTFAAAGQKCVDAANNYTACAPGLHCVSDPGLTTSTCIASIANGAKCPGGSGCDAGLYCDRSDPLNTNWTCKPQATSGPCSQYEACQQPFYHCSGYNVSTTVLGSCRPTALEGQSCKNGFGDCVGGTYCNTGGSVPGPGVSGTCTIFPGVPNVCGQYGAEWIECMSSYCNATTGQGACTPYITLGNACSTTGPRAQCGPGNYCTAGPPIVCAVACP